MSDYGVIPTGFQRKPLALILAEVEAQNITEFGPAVIQTPQSPLGQLNGLLADFAGEMWEFLEDVYQSYDPDQAEGVRLDMLAKIRLLQRASGESDQEFRQAITNAGRGRIDTLDIARAIRDLAGVTYVQVFTNDSNTVDSEGLSPATIAIAVLGGDDNEIAAELRRYVVPGISTQGNVEISTNIDGFCRSMKIVRPLLVPVKLNILVQLSKDAQGCPPPSSAAIKSGLLNALAGSQRVINGQDITFFMIRSIIESQYPNVVEVLSVTIGRDSVWQPQNQPVDIVFTELATFAADDITITVEGL